jgi:hypothetical protein
MFVLHFLTHHSPKVILSVRTFVVWNRTRVIGVLLVVLVVADVVVRINITHIFLDSIECTYCVCRFLHFFSLTVCADAPPPYPGFRGYLAIKVTNIFWATYTLKLVLYICRFC